MLAVLLLLAFVSSSLSDLMCHTYIHAQPVRTIDVGLTSCKAEKCSSMVATLSNGWIWKAGGCDNQNQCQGTGGRRIMSRDEFNGLIARAGIGAGAPQDVTHVTVDGKCCTKGGCNAPQ